MQEHDQAAEVDEHAELHPRRQLRDGLADVQKMPHVREAVYQRHEQAGSVGHLRLVEVEAIDGCIFRVFLLPYFI
jgi:hypothetical protein